MKRLVISDIHLGTQGSQEDKLLKFLSKLDCDELILAGDIVDFIRIPKFSELTPHIFKIIDNFEGKIVYVVGNHDISLMSLIDHKIFGIEFKEVYEFEDSGKKIRIEHGDRFEHGIIHYRNLMKIISVFQGIIENIFNIDLLTKWVNFKVRKRKFLNIWNMIEPDDKEELDVLIIGHTHTPEVLIWIDEKDKIRTYINVGDWVEHTTYVTIEDGITRLRTYKGD